MNKVTLSIGSDVLDTFPDVQVAAVRAKIDDAAALQSAIEQLKGDAERLRDHLENIEPITSMPEIASWRAAYGAMGVKPSKFHSSIEALMRRVKKGQDISTGLEIVDFYNLVSISQKSPIGAYDAKKLTSSEIVLRKSDPSNDSFVPLGGSAEAFPLSKGLVVYASGGDVLCWGFNTRDSSVSCVDQGSKEVLFFSETTDPEQRERPAATMRALADALGDTDAQIVTLASSIPSGRL